MGPRYFGDRGREDVVKKRTYQAKHGGVDGDAQAERGHRGDSEPGRSEKLTKHKPDVGECAFQGRPLPHLTTALFDSGEVAELAASRILRLLPSHPPIDEVGDFFLEVLVDGLRQFVVAAVACENLFGQFMKTSLRPQCLASTASFPHRQIESFAS